MRAKKPQKLSSVITLQALEAFESFLVLVAVGWGKKTQNIICYEILLFATAVDQKVTAADC